LYLKDRHGIQHRCQGVRLRVIIPVRKSPDLDSVYLSDIPSLHNQPEFGRNVHFVFDEYGIYGIPVIEEQARKKRYA